MQQAKYTMLIPQEDNLGNPLQDVAAAAHHWLHQSAMKLQASKIERNKTGFWRDNDPEQFDELITIVEETPDMDSHMKNLAAQVAEACNQWGIHATKESGGGMVAWDIRNPSYRDGEPAVKWVLADPPPSVKPQVSPSQDL